MRYATLLLLLAGFSLLPAEDPDEIETARGLFPPHVTQGVLEGQIPAPAGFDDAIANRIGRDRLSTLRAGTDRVSGRENDAAALCLLRLHVDPASLRDTGAADRKGTDADRPGPGPAGRRPGRGGSITVVATGSKYKTASGKTSGAFRTGQDADIVLSAIGFNQSGGPLLFNHPMGIAGDGTRLLLADTYNHRVLVWTTLPDSNTPPDLVLGQADFGSNDSGAAPDRMNFPVNVACGGGRVVVADTENHRLLVWNSFPTKCGQPADLVLAGAHRGIPLDPSRSAFHWPWGVWTDGKRLAVSSTRGGWVRIWNTFPTRTDQPSDLTLTGSGKLGTPRTITSNGECLIVGDHNAKIGQGGAGTFVWKTFPTRDDQPYDYFMTDPAGPAGPGGHAGPWLRGNFLEDGRLALLGATLFLWKGVPADENVRPDLTISGFDFRGGDHVGSASVGGRLYICTGNRNQIVVYREIPTRSDQAPDFAIGSPDLQTNTLDTKFIMSNPVPASNGRSLFVASDFDRRLYVWKQIPDESGAHPDFVYSLPEGPWDIALWKETLVLAGRRSVYVWRKLPLAGERPDLVLTDRIGSVRLEDLRGAACDDRYFYLSDLKAEKVHIWKGIPSSDSEPVLSLDAENPARLSSDGEWLAIAQMAGHTIRLYRVKDLEKNPQPLDVGAPTAPGRSSMFNLIPSAQVYQGGLFVAEAPEGRVHIWNRLEDALDGKRADILLGASDWSDITPETGRAKLHYPASVCFDGSWLWVGETKFSERLLRFSPKSER